MKRNLKKLLAYCTLIGIVSLGPLFSSSASAAVGDTIADTFPDQELAQVVADTVSGGDVNTLLTQSMVDNYTSLNGAGRGIQDLTGIETLVNLRTVILNGNEISSLPDSITQLTQLKVVDLNQNKITYLPENIGDMTTLTHLYLDDNQLTRLPDSIETLDTLYYLRVASNQLTNLPDIIGDLDNLQYLDVSDNLLTKLPESIGNAKYLWHFGGASNQLTSLPDSFANLVNAWEFELANNLLPTGYADILTEMGLYGVTEEPQRQLTLNTPVNPYFINHEGDLMAIDLWNLVSIDNGTSLLPQHQLIMDNYVDENGQPVSINDYIENGEVINSGKVFAKVRAIGTGLFPNTSDRAATFDLIELNFFVDSGDGATPPLPPIDGDGDGNGNGDGDNTVTPPNDGDGGNTLIPPMNGNGNSGNGTLTASTDTGGNNNVNTEAPQTGDSTQLILFSILLLGAGMGIIAMKRQKKNS